MFSNVACITMRMYVIGTLVCNCMGYGHNGH